MTAPTLPELLIWTGAGAGLGAVYLHLVARSVAAVLAPGSGLAAAGWLLLRVALAAAVLGLAATHGAAPLLLALAGFLIARTVALRRAKGA